MKPIERKSRLWGVLLKVLFPKADIGQVYFAFWKYISMPKGTKECPVTLVVHESVHLEQQGGLFGAIKWWFKYVLSKKFRYSQELEAYQVQVKWFDDTQKAGLKKRYLYRKEIARMLASPMYGNMVSEDEAFLQLK